MPKPVRNRLMTRYAFNLLDFEDFPKTITEINHLRSQSLELDSLRHTKGELISRLQTEAELNNEITRDFSVSRGTPLPEVKKALLAQYKENRVFRENLLDLEIVQAQKNTVKMVTNVCYKILSPLEDITGNEAETEIIDTLKKIIENLTNEKNELEKRRKINLVELKKRQELVRLLEKRVSKTAAGQEASMKAALDNLNADKELKDNEMLLLALHRWKTFNFRLRESLHVNYLRYVDMFTRLKQLEKKIFNELLIAPPVLYEAHIRDYKEKAGSSVPATPTDSLYDIVCERSNFPFHLAHMSVRTEAVTGKWERTNYIKTVFRETGTVIRERNLSFNPKTEESSDTSSRKTPDSES